MNNASGWTQAAEASVALNRERAEDDMGSANNELSARHQKIERRVFRLLLILAIGNVVSCAAGVWGITVAGPELFGDDILAGTPFEDRYGLAGLLLGFVGLVQLITVIVHLKQRPWTRAAHAIAGMTMMIFIFVEVIVIDEHFLLQPIFFALGALQLSLSPLVRGLLPQHQS